MNVGRAIAIHDQANRSLVDRPGWLRDRQKHIGGSESGYLAGIFRNALDPKPYESKLSVYLAKTEEISDEPRPITDNIPAERGLFLEAFAAQIYEERTGLVTMSVPMLRDPDHAWKTANPDRMVLSRDGECLRGLEIKCPMVNSRHQWSAGVPLIVRAQCQWYMTITGFKRWDVISLIDCDDTIYTLEHDQQLSDRLHTAARAFWYDHVVPRKPPGPEFQAVAEWIQEYAQPVKGSFRQSTDTEDEIGERILRCKDRIAALSLRKAQLQGELSGPVAKEKVERVTAEGWTLRSSERAGKIAWAKVAEDLARQLSLAQGAEQTAPEILGKVAPEYTGKPTRSVVFRPRG